MLPSLRFDVRSSKDPRLSRVATVDVNWSRLQDQLTMVCVRDAASTTVNHPWAKRMVQNPPRVTYMRLKVSSTRVSIMRTEYSSPSCWVNEQGLPKIGSR